MKLQEYRRVFKEAIQYTSYDQLDQNWRKDFKVPSKLEINNLDTWLLYKKLLNLKPKSGDKFKIKRAEYVVGISKPPSDSEKRYDYERYMSAKKWMSSTITVNYVYSNDVIGVQTDKYSPWNGYEMTFIREKGIFYGSVEENKDKI